MTRSSLRLRLALAGAVAICLSLALAGWGLTLLFSAHVERRAVGELETHLDQVLGALERGASGALILGNQPADPRFRQPYGGLYWQIDTAGETLRSRSLWDWQLTLPALSPTDGLAVLHDLRAPDGRRLLGVERSVVLPPSLGGETVTLLLAMDRDALSAATRGFAEDLLPYLALLAVALIAAGWLQLRIGLRPLGELGRRLSAIRTGDAERLGENLPSEVSPLASDFDALLAAREAEMQAARQRAGDLAHGLKTPLQALLGESQRLRQAGHEQTAESIEQIVGSMRQHVDRELTRTRVASRAGGACSDVAAVVAQVVDVIVRTPAGARLDWDTLMTGDGGPGPTAGAPMQAALDPADLAEALGTLVENAARYASRRVEITARINDAALIEMGVRDDGPGLPESALTGLLDRGARLDECGGNTGLGLAICREIAEGAGGGLTLENAHPGLRARLTLPAVRQARRQR
ncbi:HAMP domain-containing sensor histidine kinase [Spiribacter sp. 221]|uniref:ATP-binding protein n=1 Tax=Spiribacter onubensis TaxID=3122420 RepID=UPI00349F3C34